MNTLNFQSKTKSDAPAVKRAYVELPGLQHETKDVLKQLDANILLLEDLGGRLNFMLGELRSLIRR